MELLLDLSLYPVNALAYEDSMRVSTPRFSVPRPTERVSEVAQARAVSTDTLSQGSQNRRQAQPRRRAAPPMDSYMAQRFPLSASQVRARYG